MWDRDRVGLADNGGRPVPEDFEYTSDNNHDWLDESGLQLKRRPRAPSWPGGLDPRSLRARPAWHRFLPRGRVEALLRELSDDDLLGLA